MLFADYRIEWIPGTTTDTNELLGKRKKTQSSECLQNLYAITSNSIFLKSLQVCLLHSVHICIT